MIAVMKKKRILHCSSKVNLKVNATNAVRLVINQLIAVLTTMIVIATTITQTVTIMVVINTTITIIMGGTTTTTIEIETGDKVVMMVGTTAIQTTKVIATTVVTIIMKMDGRWFLTVVRVLVISDRNFLAPVIIATRLVISGMNAAADFEMRAVLVIATKHILVRINHMLKRDRK
jgi:hypothetical protein